MNHEEILAKVIEVVSEVTEYENPTADTDMQDDIGIESMAFYELLGQLEKAFDITIPERILARVDTVEDIANEVEKILG